MAFSLPDAAWRDLNFDFNIALHHHRRAEAAAVLAVMAEKAPDHPLRHHMEAGLAFYDDDDDRAFKASEALAGLFPDEPRLISRQVYHARRTGRRDDVLALLRKAATAKNAHPSRWRDLAIESETRSSIVMGRVSGRYGSSSASSCRITEIIESGSRAVLTMNVIVVPALCVAA